MEPGTLCERLLPCDARWELMWWRLIVPAKPLPPLLDRARAALRSAGLVVADAAVSAEGPDLVVALDASESVNFDEQLLVQWAQAFGALGPLTGQAVHVVTTAAGVPLVRVTAQRGDILALAHGDLELGGFMTKLQFTSLQVVDMDAVTQVEVPSGDPPKPVLPRPAVRPRPPAAHGPFIRARNSR